MQTVLTYLSIFLQLQSSSAPPHLHYPFIVDRFEISSLKSAVSYADLQITDLRRRLEEEMAAAKLERAEKEKYLAWTWSLEHNTHDKEAFAADRAASLSASEEQKAAFDDALAASERRGSESVDTWLCAEQRRDSQRDCKGTHVCI